MEAGGSPRGLLNRGGRFDSFEDAYEGDHMSHKFGKLMNIYVEDVATTRNSITGKYFDGLPRYEPPLHSDGTPVEDSKEEFPFNLITYKTIMGGNSRTISQTWSHVSVDPENKIPRPTLKGLGRLPLTEPIYRLKVLLTL
jgi:hypothetical protein